MTDHTFRCGDTVRFRSGLIVALTDAHGSTWRVLVLRPIDSFDLGDSTYMAEVLLNQGELLDWDAVERAEAQLHEIYSVADRDIISEVTDP